jgi:type I restriction enzyme R subunit
MTALEERQISTGEAMAKIENLMEEKLKAEKARKESGLDPDTFEIFWFLQHEKIPTATMLAKEINAVYSRFPNFASNSDEQRQLKAEIYKSLLREVSGRRMVEIGEGLLRLKGIR